MKDQTGAAAPPNQDADNVEMSRGFLTAEDTAPGQEFLRDGYIVQQVSDAGALQKIRVFVVTLAAEHLGIAYPGDEGAFLNYIHERVTVADLNAMRLAVYNGINAEPWLREAYFDLARWSIEALVGNELAMQRRVNLSIQLPNDDSSLLPVHADVWSGDSPFEIVAWLPLVNCRQTKSMYLLPPVPNRKVSDRLHEFASQSAEDLFQAIEPDVEWIEFQCGKWGNR